jgi:hypothetical protein
VAQVLSSGEGGVSFGRLSEERANIQRESCGKQEFQGETIGHHTSGSFGR